MKVIVIAGSPGAGKNTVTRALAETLRVADVSHVVIDPDEMAIIYPEIDSNNLKWDVIKTIYPIYKKIGFRYVLIPVVLDEDQDLQKIKDAVSVDKVQVINLSVDVETLKRRVTEREPNEYWQNKLVNLVVNYCANESSRTFPRINIDANNKTPDEIASEVLSELGIGSK